MDSFEETVFYIASGDGSITDKDRCLAQSNTAKTSYEAMVDLAFGACEVALASGKITLDLELGVGMKYEANQNICKNAQTAGKSSAAYVGSKVLEQHRGDVGLVDLVEAGRGA